MQQSMYIWSLFTWVNGINSRNWMKKKIHRFKDTWLHITLYYTNKFFTWYTLTVAPNSMHLPQLFFLEPTWKVIPLHTSTTYAIVHNTMNYIIYHLLTYLVFHINKTQLYADVIENFQSKTCSDSLKMLSLGIVWCTLKQNTHNRLLTSPRRPTPISMPAQLP